jgi:anti-anti-sigma factor
MAGTRLQVRRSGEGVSVHGEIDISNTELFEGAVAHAATSDPAVLDMTGVEFMDSSGLAVLLAAATDAGRARPLVILPSPFVGRLLRITGLDRHAGIVLDDRSDTSSDGEGTPAE